MTFRSPAGPCARALCHVRNVQQIDSVRNLGVVMSLKPIALSLSSVLVTVLAAAPSYGQGDASAADSGLVLEEVTVTAR